MDTSLLPLIITSLVFAFFFAGIEIAFLSANKLQIEIQGKQGVVWAKDREITSSTYGPALPTAGYGVGPWGRYRLLNAAGTAPTGSPAENASPFTTARPIRRPVKI